MRGHVTTRVDRVFTNFLQGGGELCSPNSLVLRPDDGNDAGGADRVETLRGRVVAYGGGWITVLFLESKEDIDAGSDRAGFQRFEPKL